MNLLEHTTYLEKGKNLNLGARGGTTWVEQLSHGQVYMLTFQYDTIFSSYITILDTLSHRKRKVHVVQNEQLEGKL